MRRPCKILIVFSILFFLSGAARAQGEFSPDELEKLKEAERTADRFIERFRRTLDFGPVWKQFRSEKYKCRLVKSDLVISGGDSEKLKIGMPALERGYVAFFNGYFLGGAYIFSLVPLEMEESKAERLISKHIKKPGSSGFLGGKGKSPGTARELASFITKADRAAAVLRRKMPLKAMKNEVWRANFEYLISHRGGNLYGTQSGNDDFCAAQDEKIYTIDKGFFFFYLAEEKGEMKIIDFGVGN